MVEVLICQACGSILKSQSKTCKGCGTASSKFAATALSSVSQEAALAVQLHNDPLVVERTVNHLIYTSRLAGNGNGNGHGNGSGNGNGNGSSVEHHSDAFLAKVDGKPWKKEADTTPDLSSGLAKYNELRAPAFGNAQSAADLYSEPQPHTAAAISQSEAGEAEANKETEMPEAEARETEAREAATRETAIREAAIREAEAREAEQSHAFAPAQVEENSLKNQPAQPAGDFFGQAPAHQSDPAKEFAAELQVQAAKAEEAVSQQTFAAENQTSTFSAAPQAANTNTDSSKANDPERALTPAEIVAARVAAAAAAAAASGAAAAATNAAFLAAAQNETSIIKSPLAAGGAPAGETLSESRQSAAEPSKTVEPPVEKIAPAPAPAPASSGSFFDQGGFFEAKPAPAQAPFPSATSASPAAKNHETASFIPDLPDETKVESKQAASGNNNDDDDDDGSSDDDEDESPKSLSKTKAAGSRTRSSGKSKNDSQSKSSKGLKREDRFAKNKGRGREPEQKIQIMGFSIAKGTLITLAVLAVFAGFPVLVLVANIASIVSSLNPGGAQNQQQQHAANPGGGINPFQQPAQNQNRTANGMNGTWQIAYQNPGGKIGRGAIDISQSGKDIQGWGVDNNGQFQINGTLEGSTATFTKMYVQNGKPAGKPIQYQGTVSVPPQQGPGSPLMTMAGNWQLSKREGFGWRGRVVTYSGRFEAQLTQVATASAGGNQQSSAVPIGKNDVPKPKPSPQDQHAFFLKIALGIIGVGVGLAMLSLRFFGPSGLLNIWAKKEYIPSQFKSQHFKMVKEMGKTMRPGDLPLGTRVEWGLHQFWLPKRLNLPDEVRNKNPHLFLLGAGATGKSRLMASLIAQDIEAGDRAVVLVDSDGALADLIIDWIASRPNGASIAKRVVIVDPTCSDHVIAYNPLEFPPDGDLQNCASALVFGFKAAYTEPPGAQSQWNQQTANILRNAAILLMANNKTLTDLPVLLSDNDFRDVLLEKVERLKDQRSEYITLVDAWTNYKRLARTDQWITWIEPILNRVQPMLSDPRLRAVLTKPESELDLQKIISDKQILIVKIPQGQLDKNGNLLGSLLVAGVKQAALSLSSHGKRGVSRKCSLYLDEFESFIEKETFDAITTETRKLQIGFCGASKTLQTLPEDFRNKIVINVGVIAIFALAKKDADMLGPQMFRVDGRKVKHQTIQNVFNKVNTSPQFELIMDEEKLNIDRVVGQEKRNYFCYRVGSVAGVFLLKAPDFNDLEEKQLNKDLIEKMRSNRQDDLDKAISDAADADADEEDDDEEDLDESDSDDDEDEEEEEK